MTKCLLKALKAVDLHNYIDLFRLLGYDSAGALAHFHPDHFKQLHLTDEELARFRALLDVLQQATREGKICPHYCKSSRQGRSTSRRDSIRISSSIEGVQYRHGPATMKKDPVVTKKQSHHDIKPKRSKSSIDIHGRSSSSNATQKQHADGFLLQRPSSVTIPTRKNYEQSYFGPKALMQRPVVEHVKVRVGIVAHSLSVDSPRRRLSNEGD